MFIDTPENTRLDPWTGLFFTYKCHTDDQRPVTRSQTAIWCILVCPFCDTDRMHEICKYILFRKIFRFRLNSLLKTLSPKSINSPLIVHTEERFWKEDYSDRGV